MKRWLPMLVAHVAVVGLGCGAAGGVRHPGRSGDEGGGGASVTTRGTAYGADDPADIDALVSDLLDTAPLPDPVDAAHAPGIEIDVSREAWMSGGGGESARAAVETASARRLAHLDTSETRVTTATDGTSASLLVRTARFVVAVYQVRETIAQVRAVAEALGGFVAREGDRVVVIRVPVARFDDAVVQVSGSGDVLRREIRTTDVGEEFHDNETRIATLEAMMTRLQQLLARADDVAGALAVERELERVTMELERMRGRQRYLADRVAYATIAVELRELAHDEIEQADLVVLPFHWLRELGLSRLLRLEGTGG